MQKIESKEEVNDFNCFNTFDGRLVPVDPYKAVTKTGEKTAVFAFLPDRFKEEVINNNGLIRLGIKILIENSKVQRSNRN